VPVRPSPGADPRDTARVQIGDKHSAYRRKEARNDNVVFTRTGTDANVAVGAQNAPAFARHGNRVTFAGWLRYGIPFTAAQLAVSALYVLALFYFVR